MEWMSLPWPTPVDLPATTLFPAMVPLSWNSSLIDMVREIWGPSLMAGGHSMSDPGTTYRTREEIQNMRSSNDAIQGLKHKLLEWNIVTENELKAPVRPAITNDRKLTRPRERRLMMK